MTTLTDRARELYEVLFRVGKHRLGRVPGDPEELIAQDLREVAAEAEKRGAAREREALAALYDEAADELDKQSVDALTAKKHRDFAAYLRNRESDT